MYIIFIHLIPQPMKFIKTLLFRSLLIFGSFSLLISWATFAQLENPGFAIMPEIEDPSGLPDVIIRVGASGGEVMNNYNKEAETLPLSQQMATGIMNWDTILQYLVYVIRLVSEIWLFIGAGMIIYAGYLYASNIFSEGQTTKAGQAVKYAIIGVLVISFAFAIMRIFTSAFLGT